MSFKKIIIGTTIALVGGLCQGVVAQTKFPSKPVRIVVPHQPGSTTETFGRLLTIDMSESLGQPIVIEPKPGAAGTIGAREVAHSKPDGYTALMNASIQMMYPGMYQNLPFDVHKDFVPVGIFGFAPMVVVVSPTSKINSFKEMIDQAKATPGKLSFASGGLGSLPHLVGEMVNMKTGVKISHVPYNETGQALNDVMGGHVDILYASVASAAPLIHGGKLKALAVTSSRRVDLLPQVPTIEESGISNFDVSSWYALWAPKGTPKSIIETLNKSMRDASSKASVQARMRDSGVLPSQMTSDEFARFQEQEGEKWLAVMRQAGVKPN